MAVLTTPEAQAQAVSLGRGGRPLPKVPASVAAWLPTGHGCGVTGMPFYKIRLRDQYGRLRDVFLDAADMKAAKDKAEGQADRKETLTMTRIRLAAREEYLTVIQAPNDELPPVR